MEGAKKGELEIHYQPQISLSTGEMTGVEGWVRWQHPKVGLIPASKFLPIAEETGLIVPIGEWTLRTVCAQNKAWQEAGFPPMRMTINLLARQFQEKRLSDTIAQVLEDTGLSPAFLELEITESDAMQDVDDTIAKLQMLKEIGVQLSIDSFGVGYSSLSYLKQFPIDRLKIGQSFVQGIPTDRGDVAITTALVTLAHSLELKVIAEGVETEAQLAFLRSLQCDEAQGFLLSPPVPGGTLTKQLQTGKWKH
ncbi:EAL domain-containing protein [Candidatus Poribacteria bacterium]|nr:EAL domain-containing protein [Candidatus Poribacteria bacterium]